MKVAIKIITNKISWTATWIECTYWKAHSYIWKNWHRMSNLWTYRSNSFIFKSLFSSKVTNHLQRAHKGVGTRFFIRKIWWKKSGTLSARFTGQTVWTKWLISTQAVLKAWRLQENHADLLMNISWNGWTFPWSLFGETSTKSQVVSIEHISLEI